MQEKQSAKVLLAFLHGSGGTGEELRDYLRLQPLDALEGATFRDALAEMRVDLLCPTAARRRYTLFDGDFANVWFDRVDLHATAVEDIVGIDASIDRLVNSDLAEFIAAGYKIILAGHSQGGALILHFLRKPKPSWLLGIFTSGSFLAAQSLVFSSGRLAEYGRMPIYMTHGTSDTLVEFEWGRNTAERLEELGWAVNFVAFDGILHELSDLQLERLLHWIKEALPALEADEENSPITFRIERNSKHDRHAKIVLRVPAGAEEQLAAMPVFACGGSFELRPVSSGTLEVEVESLRPEHLAQEIVARLKTRYMAPAPADLVRCAIM